MQSEQVFLTAAVCFAELVAEIPLESYDGVGLGEWDLRALVGHTSRALITVEEYLTLPEADEATLPSAVAYYVAALGGATYPGEVADRGRQAGRALGEDPAAFVADLLMDVARRMQQRKSSFVVASPAGGIVLEEYLRTRTFELVVHGLDIAKATGLPFEPPDDVFLDVVTLAGELAIRHGLGPEVLLALTGREPLHPEFTIL